MAFPARPAPDRSSVRLAAGLFLAAAVAGCNSRPSAQQALDQQIKQNPQFKKEIVVKFAGKVTVDGQPPEKDCKLFVILNNPQHLDENAHLRAPRLSATCDDQGNFAFGTYDRADGVPVGKYVVTFVELHPPFPARTGPRRIPGAGQRHFSPPDELKNLYNDADKNAKEDRFSPDLHPPGKDNYEFDLTVANQEPIATPGPNAVTSITLPR